MKLTINTKTLAAALYKAQSVVESRNTIPILANVLLKLDDDALTIEGTDLDSSLSVVVTDIAHAMPGSTTVSAKVLSDIIKKLPDGDCTLTATDQNLTVTSGKSKFKVATLPAVDWPVLTYERAVSSFVMSGALLKSAFDSVAFSMSQEETRYYLNGVYAHSFEGRLRLVSTDGHRLSRLDTVEHEMAIASGIIIPRKAVIEASKLFSDAGDVTIEYSDTSISFTSDSLSFRSKLIDGTFPDYQRVIPSDNNLDFAVKADVFKPMIDRVSTVSDGKSRAVKLEWSQGEVTATVSQGENTASDTVETENAMESITVGVNSRYLIDAIARLDDTVVFHFSDPALPMILTSPSIPDYLTLVMPMRV